MDPSQRRRATISRHFSDCGLSGELLEEIVSAYDDSLGDRELGRSEPDAGHDRGGSGLTAPIANWAIRKEDVQPVALLAAILQTAIDAGFNPEAPSATTVTKAVALIAVSAAATFYDMVRRSATLPDATMRVVLALKSRPGGMTLGNLTQFLDATSKEKDPNLTEAEVLGILGALGHVRLKNGAVEAFVAKDDADRWTSLV